MYFVVEYGFRCIYSDDGWVVSVGGGWVGWGLWFVSGTRSASNTETDAYSIFQQRNRGRTSGIMVKFVLVGVGEMIR